MTGVHAPAEPSDCNDCSEGPGLPRNVRLGTGEFYWQQDDIHIVGRGLDFVWTRTYRSQPDGPVGQAPYWDHCYNLKVTATRGGIVVHNGAGATDLYRRQSSGAYAAQGVFAEGQLERGTRFLLRFSGGGAWEFRPLDAHPAAGYIARILDRNGNALRFGYDETGRLEVITDTLGRDIRLGYDRAGRVAALTDFTGRRLSYRYSADGDLTSVTYPAVSDTPTGNDFPSGATVSYAYSAPHRLSRITDRTGRTLLDIEYTTTLDRERVSALRWGRSGNPTHFTYQPSDDDDAAVLAIVNDGNGNVRELLYNATGACVLARLYTARADAGVPTTGTENRPDRPLRAGEPAFYETRYSYDNPDGLLTQIVRPDGSTVHKQFEIDLRPDASPIERGNLRSVRQTPGRAGSDTPELVRRYEYLPGFGCTCGQAFVTRDTDSSGAVRSTEYDDRGNPVLIVEPDGSRTKLSYNAFGDVIEHIWPGEDRRDTFVYSDRDGQVVTETLDADGMALTTGYQYDELGRLLVLHDPDGHDHRHVWNAWDLLVRRVLPDAGREPCTEDNRYDGNQRQVGRTVRDAGREIVETKTYDARGRLRTFAQQAERGRQVVTEYSYDDNGNRVAIRRGSQYLSRLTFDAFDRPLKRTRGKRGNGLREATFDYNARGSLVRVTRGVGAQASTLLTRYDGYNRPIEVELPNGTTVRFSRDARGNVVRQTVHGGDERPLAEVVQTYDAMDRLIRRVTSGPGVTESAVESWEFDIRGRLVHRIDPAGHSWRARYDALDQPIEIDDGAGRMIAYAYDRNGNEAEQVLTDTATGIQTRTAYTRDPRGRILEVAGPQGMSRTYAYDVHDRPGTIGLPGGRRVTLDYDGLGRPTATRFAAPDDVDGVAIHQVWSDSSQLVARTDPNGNTTRYRHDAADNLAEVQHPDGTRQTYSFDTRGNCTGWTDANGTAVVNTYDRMDRLVRRRVKAGAGVATDTTTESYRYDELGRLLLAKNDRHTVEWRYDALGRVISQVQDGQQITAGYDGAGRRTSVGYPSGYRLDLEYKGTDLRRMSDRSGPAVEFEPGGITRFPRTRGPVGTTVDWNSAGLPERLVTAAGPNTVDERRYRWDASANVTGVEITDSHGRRDVTYNVDALDRLRGSATSTGHRVGYELDPAGNRTVVSIDGAPGSYTLEPAANRYTATPADRRSYDANGNLVSVADTRGNRRTMRYDYRNRMVEFRDDAAGLTAHYSYDCLGRRLLKSVSGGERPGEFSYVFDADVIVEQRRGNETRSLVRNGNSVYGLVTDGPVGDSWFVSDVLGSVVAEFDESGSVTRSYSYGDFGEPATGDGDTPPVSFAGYTFDTESGLYYVRSRYLEPATGRFTTRDPAGVWEDGRNRGNAYTYVGNNPVAFVDPTGESTTTLYKCNGPWPGPRTIQVEYEGCSKSRRTTLVNPVCRAFRASGQAKEKVFSLWVNDYTGIAQPGASTTRSRVTYWFGGPDNGTSLSSKSEISGTLADVFTAIKSDDFDIDCEGTDGHCEDASSYVVGPLGYDINVCDSFFNNGWSISMQAGVLIHELTHAYNDTDDYFYYLNETFSNMPYNAWIETPMLRENADNYRMFVMNYFLP